MLRTQKIKSVEKEKNDAVGIIILLNCINIRHPIISLLKLIYEEKFATPYSFFFNVIAFCFVFCI
jgi:hypothetical protein